MNYNENYNDKKRNRKKGFVIVLSLVTALAVVAGSLLAYFSDVFTSSTELTAGTLILDGETKFYINDPTLGSEADEDDLACINPGDIIYVKCTVTNQGSKSAWIKSFFSISAPGFDDQQMSESFSVYQGTGTSGTQLSFDSVSGAAAFSDDNASVLNGITETESLAQGEGDGRTSTMTFTIVFNSSAGNEYQDATINITYVVKALQYRNNEDVQSLNWNLAVPYTPVTP